MFGAIWRPNADKKAWVEDEHRGNKPNLGQDGAVGTGATSDGVMEKGECSIESPASHCHGSTAPMRINPHIFTSDTSERVDDKILRSKRSW